MKKCHYFFFFFFFGLQTCSQQHKPKTSRSRLKWGRTRVRKTSKASAAEQRDGSAEWGRMLWENWRSANVFSCSQLTWLIVFFQHFFFFFFMRLWNRPRLSFPVNDFISSLDCCLGCGLVCIYFNYEQWKSALAARLVAPTGTKLFLLRRET